MATGPMRGGGWQWHRPRPWRAGRLFVLALLVNVGVVAFLVVGSTRLGFAPASATGQAVGAPPGFLWGLWHGLVLPVAFVASFFRPSVGLYAGVHDGHAYDAGFLLGAFVVLHWPFARVTSTVHHHHHHDGRLEGPEPASWPPPLRPDWAGEVPSRTGSPSGPTGPQT